MKTDDGLRYLPVAVGLFKVRPRMIQLAHSGGNFPKRGDIGIGDGIDNPLRKEPSVHTTARIARYS